MKKLHFLHVVLLFSLYSKLSCASGEVKDSICLEINGKISLISSSESNLYLVELILGNEIIDSQKVRDTHSFQFFLNKNSFYTIRITKKGYTPKIVSINTKISEKSNFVYLFEFETSLIKEQDAINLDQEAIEFPIAIIEYQPKIDWFSYNEKYTRNIKSSIYKFGDY